MRRTYLPAAFGFAAGLAVGWLLWSHSEAPRAPTVAASVPVSSATAPDALRRDAPRHSRRAAAAATEPAGEAPSNPATPPVPVTADVREVALADAPTGWAELVVDFRDSDGHAVGPGQGFNVVPSVRGARVTDPWDVDDGAAGQTDADGHVRLRVASPGRYDVWTTSGMAYVLVRGIDVPATSVVHIEKPSFADVTLSLDDAAAPGDAAIHVAIEGFPGEEVTSGGAVLTAAAGAWNLQLKASVRTVASLVSAMRWRVRAPEGFVATPSEVKPPATVVVRRSAAGSRKLRVEWRIAAAAPAPPFARTIRFDWRIDGEALVHDAVSIDPGQWGDGAVASASEFSFPAPTGTLRWSGPDVEAGSLRYDLSESDTAAPVLQLPPAASAVVRVDVETTDGAPPPTIPVVLADAGDPRDTAQGELVPGTEATLAASRWIVALPTRGPDGVPDDRVAGPVLVRGGERHVLHYVRGGYAIVAPRVRLPTNAGAVEVARADGGPMVFCDSDGAPQVQEFVPIAVGTVLGPFEPGLVTLDLFVGRVRWARYEVPIRVDEHTALQIGAIGARR